MPGGMRDPSETECERDDEGVCISGARGAYK